MQPTGDCWVLGWREDQQSAKSNEETASTALPNMGPWSYRERTFEGCQGTR